MHATSVHPPEVTTQQVIPMLAPISRRTVHFSGRVQGVGFRYTARSIAQEYDVAGYVRNLSDGRVELVLEGRETETSRVVDTLCRKMRSFVRDVRIEVSPPTGEFEQFAIRHG